MNFTLNPHKLLNKYYDLGTFAPTMSL